MAKAAKGVCPNYTKCAFCLIRCPARTIQKALFCKPPEPRVAEVAANWGTPRLAAELEAESVAREVCDRPAGRRSHSDPGIPIPGSRSLNNICSLNPIPGIQIMGMGTGIRNRKFVRSNFALRLDTRSYPWYNAITDEGELNSSQRTSYLLWVVRGRPALHPASIGVRLLYESHAIALTFCECFFAFYPASAIRDLTFRGRRPRRSRRRHSCDLGRSPYT